MKTTINLTINGTVEVKVTKDNDSVANITFTDHSFNQVMSINLRQDDLYNLRKALLTIS